MMVLINIVISNSPESIKEIMDIYRIINFAEQLTKTTIFNSPENIIKRLEESIISFFKLRPEIQKQVKDEEILERLAFLLVLNKELRHIYKIENLLVFDPILEECEELTKDKQKKIKFPTPLDIVISINSIFKMLMPIISKLKDEDLDEIVNISTFLYTLGKRICDIAAKR